MTDIKAIPTEQLREHVKRLYNAYMFYEAAERGYDHESAHAALREYLTASRELDSREKAEKGILELAEELKSLCDAVIGGAQ